MPAPIALFAFNRPEHLKRTLAALAANELASESDLYVFCDGPRNVKEALRCMEVVHTAHEAVGFKSVTVRQQEANRGLAPSIIEGVNQVVATAGSVIVLEDDLTTSPYFLRYMNDALTLYADNPKVASVLGWSFPHDNHLLPETFFLKGTDCLGWGTWKRAWDLFEPDAGLLLKELRKKGLNAAFNANDSYNYTEMLRAVKHGMVSSWAVRWRATAYLHDMYTLHPGRSLVQHEGSDGSGSNVGVTDLFDVPMTTTPVTVTPQPVEEDPHIRSLDMQFHRRFSPGAQSLLQRLKQGILQHHLVQKNKHKIIDWLPPALYRFILRVKGQRPSEPLSWQGDYPNWESACAACGEKGSDAPECQQHEAMCQQHGALCNEKEYDWPLVAGFMAVAAQHNGALHVLDYGGTLGCRQQQINHIVQLLPNVTWHSVSPPNAGFLQMQQAAPQPCTFHESIQDCFAKNPINVMVFSGILQYLHDPYAVLQEALACTPDALLIDRTPFLPARDKLTVQHVHEAAPSALRPCWWLNRCRVASLFANRYTCLPDYQSPVDPAGFYGFLAVKRRL
ncbi:methyltransferase, TIGR04325 family [Desulfovibrio cuneatus]|uniref:methyltransferase, TIGR04325 family n=1 Tax=Desulfovibrio cuneatus TaxID=159728 RepID=UPI00040309C1|nr:methyltransferase, TIGR04325 family [Desulfovibrio cuneatus]